MRERGLHLRVMLCWRGLGTTHTHRPFTTYILSAKIAYFYESEKHLMKIKEEVHHTSSFIFILSAEQ